MKGEITLSGTRWGIGPQRFASPSEILVASTPHEVIPALEAAESAARAGLWAVGHIAYEAASGMSPQLRTLGPTDTPLVWFGLYDAPCEGPSASGTGFTLHGWQAAMSAPAHSEHVSEIRRSIVAGDTYQVNLTFPMTARFEGDPMGLFGAMRDAQPDSYAAHIDTGDEVVVSVSPELFLHVDSHRIVARPMKGTAPRGRWPDEDRLAADGLQRSEKERAGNVMIVDLIRNDLGRVAVSGSIEVPELFAVERHPTVWQLTSTVAARLSRGETITSLLVATFPSGSVTGAPKTSTMGIIADHEVGPRGVYCGAIGYIRPGGRQVEFSVAIRTGVIRGDRFTYHVGGGITHDSIARREYEECLWKAAVVTEPRQCPGLLESMLVEAGEGIPLLESHLARLEASAGYFGLPFDPVKVGEALSGLRVDRSSKARLILSPDGSVALETDSFEPIDQPVQLRLSDVRVDPSNPLWYHKTVDRRRYPLSEEGMEMILVNLGGQVTETNRSNIYARFDGSWLTPRLDCGCLPGVYRARLIDSGMVGEAILTVDDLTAADEIAVTNAVRGWRKAVLVG